MDENVVVNSQMNILEKLHHRDTDNTKKAQRRQVRTLLTLTAGAAGLRDE